VAAPDGPFGRPDGPAGASTTNMALVNVLADVISPEELAVWRSLQRAQVTIMRRIEYELLERHDLPHASFDVLQQLAQTAGQRLRMNDLADRVLLSRSGLTRLVDRLEREGLVERHACASDARGLFAVLTSAGRRRLEDATPTYHRCIREGFLDLLGPDELRQVAATASKLAE
jgi:DNA-binding MarR family transcriptional regulator